ncbi:MAG: thiol-disulfide isomerase/thioredoxin [Planctomycetota bacterium]|jgi:thiol-disulfide isomerase/thioredoxin
MQFIKKHFLNIFFVVFIAIIFLNPLGVGMEIRSALIRLVSFSPSTISENKRETLQSYSWKLKDANGNALDFNSLKGKVVLVNMFATWCPPCVAEMPSLEKLYKDYGDKIVFLIVAHDTPQKVDPFILKNAFTMPIFYEETRALKEFKTSSIPATFLINQKGEIVISKKGAANWNSLKTRKIIDDLL